MSNLLSAGGRAVLGRDRLVALALGLVFGPGLALGLAGAIAPARAADEMPVFAIELKDGTMTPLRLEVPAGRTFKIELRNSGVGPAEFESTELHKEKVLAPQSDSFVVIRNLPPGEYGFFDDFHPDAGHGVLVAK